MIQKEAMIKVLGIFMISIFMLTSCSDNTESQDPMEEEQTPMGRLQLQITDSPVDDANVKAVFITAAAIELDGKTIDFNAPKKIEISALIKGNVETLFDQTIEAKNYSQMSLILAGEVNGEMSNYVLTKNDVQHNLLSSTNQIKIPVPVQDIEIAENGNFSAVLDFDLRKSIKYNHSNESDQYDFDGNLDGSIRLVEGESFKIEGEVSDQLGIADDKIVVFAYEKGTFDVATETNGDIHFKNAVSSSAVEENGQFSIHFLTEGNYELVLANYKMTSNGQLTLESILNTEILAGFDLSIVTLDADITTNLTILSKLEI